MSEVRSNFAGASVVVGLTGLAGYLAPAPPDVEVVFNITAVGSGLAGYWIGSGDAARSAAVRHRFLFGLGAVVIIPLLSYYYWTYYVTPTPGWIEDILGFLSFSAVFAVICFLLGVLRIDIIKTDQVREEGEA